MTTVKKFDNGLKLIVNEMEGVFSVSTGIIVKAGSRLEDDENNGISHFIEHTTFKGTKRFNSKELSEEFDNVGSQVNAFTSKEMTCYYVKSTTFALERSFELLSDMFINSTYPSDELEKEKGVVIEEINMSADTPEDVCLDLLSKAYFGDDGLGKTILGPEKNIKSFNKNFIDDYRRRFYTLDNIVISFAGKINFNEALRLVEKYFVGLNDKTSEKPDYVSKQNKGKILKLDKKIEQVHLGISFDGVKFNDKNVDKINFLNNVLGAGMSSRLFQKVREELGLCYTVYSYPSCYLDCGSFEIYAGVNSNKVKDAYDGILSVIDTLKKEGVKKDEVERCRSIILSSLAFGQESTSSIMMLYGKYLLFTDCVYDFNEKLKAISSVSFGEVNDYVKKFDFSSPCVSIVGKNAKKVDIE